ncbi:glucose-1-phosphate cytidylyltransferase [Proteinivorax hydrogeniformans]|uniref:Glucose-1-phosphate cytidylyltransferase n=1 Tax=Proteinivorax hydrogeniformans TaxID=1826727 RepID=A0AAU8HV49_9FIRM
MKAVILCGGKGMRMGGEVSYTCKPLIKVGGMPILWHIMKIYKSYGINEFVLCLGHNGDAIKEYFLNLDWKTNDFQLKIGSNYKEIKILKNREEWNITFADTGLDTMTGGRIKRIKKYISDDEFMLTYGDGVSDIPLDKLLNFHRQNRKIATVTGVKQKSGFGFLEAEGDVVKSFIEKPLLNGWVNGGFFVLNREVFDFIEGDKTVWEQQPLKKLVQENQLAMYQHDGFWHCMDTVKDVHSLNELWNKNDKAWVRW